MMMLDILFVKGTWNKVEAWVEPLFIIAIAIVVSKVLNFLIKRYIRKSSEMLHVDPTNYSFIQNAVSFVVFLFAVFFIIYSIPEVKGIGKTLFAGAGIAAAIIGFASQEAFSNIISGIFLVIYKPFRVGDRIKLLNNQQVGVVEDITMRHTILRSIENRRIVIPNSAISREAILNSTIVDERICMHYEVTLEYGQNAERAMEIMREEIMQHPHFLDIRKPHETGTEAVDMKVVGLEEAGIRLRAFVWTRNTDEAFDMRCDLNRKLLQRFAAEGIQFSHGLNVRLEQ